MHFMVHICGQKAAISIGLLKNTLRNKNGSYVDESVDTTVEENHSLIGFELNFWESGRPTLDVDVAVGEFLGQSRE